MSLYLTLLNNVAKFAAGDGSKRNFQVNFFCLRLKGYRVLHDFVSVSLALYCHITCVNVFKFMPAFKIMYVLTSGNYLLGALNGCTFFKIMPAVKSGHFKL